MENSFTFTPEQRTSLLDMGFTPCGPRLLLQTGDHRLVAVPSLAQPGSVFLLVRPGNGQLHATTPEQIRAFVERFTPVPV